MGEGLVSRVVSLLKGHALRAAPAGPGEPFVSPETPVAAVSILKLEPEKALGTVRVQLLVPEYMGAAACEEEATRVGLILEGDGAWWVQKAWEYRGRESVYCVPLEAEFHGVPTEDGWVPAEEYPSLRVTVGGMLREHATKFTAWQAEEGAWNYQLEEFYPAGTAEQNLGIGPFDAELTHAGVSERYCDCTITQRRRVSEAGGLRQIWEGTAERREA